jgi:hypothetical protein
MQAPTGAAMIAAVSPAMRAPTIGESSIVGASSARDATVKIAQFFAASTDTRAGPAFAILPLNLGCQIVCRF